MLKSFPKISIITVNYNKGNFIEDTILSVINQDYPNLEYIIIDGASTDNSIDIIKKYNKHLAYFVSEPDSGMTEALIKGFSKATGDILAWINSDDTYLPGTFEFVANKYNKYRFDFLYGDCYLTNINNVVTTKAKSYYTNHLAQAYGLVPIHQPSSFWSNSIYNEVKGINPDFNVTMDGDLFYRILKNSKKTIRVNKTFSTFRIHPGQSGAWAPLGRYKMERNIITKYNSSVSNLKKMFYLNYFKPYTFLLRTLHIA